MESFINTNIPIQIMEHQEQLNRMLEEFAKEGIAFPSITYDNSIPLFFTSIDKYSETLPLSASLIVRFIHSIPNSLSLESMLSANVPIDFKPEVDYKTVYDKSEDGYIPVEPEKWHTLPKRFNEESQLIKNLDLHIPNDEKSQSAQNSMAGLDSTWYDFYGELITQKKLRWADLLGEKFPYVVTNSSVLGNVGRSEGGLYFVSVDIANETWKEQVVAFHERFCQSKGHEYAVNKEQELARALGKEKEYKEWRKEINIDTANGKYFA